MWYRAPLSQDQIARGYLATIRQRFAEAVHDAGEPLGACLFVTSRDMGSGQRVAHNDDDALVDVDAIFFSPASVSTVPQIIAQCRARPSPPPERSRTELLVGRPQDWDLLPRATH